MSFITIFLGLLAGTVFSVSYLLGGLVAKRLTPIQSFSYNVIQIGLMAIISLPLAKLVGAHYGYIIRCNSGTFFISLILGYLVSSWGVYYLRKGSNN